MYEDEVYALGVDKGSALFKACIPSKCTHIENWFLQIQELERGEAFEKQAFVVDNCSTMGQIISFMSKIHT